MKVFVFAATTRMLFMYRAAVEVVPADATDIEERVMKITVDVALTRPQILGSVKVYFKDAPTDKNVDTCNFARDAENGMISSYLSISDIAETGGETLTVTVVSAVPKATTSVCWVEFLLPGSVSQDTPFT